MPYRCYRPQTKFAKIMFLQVSVCPQGRGGVHGRGACMAGGCLAGGGGGVHGMGACVAVGACMAGGACVARSMHGGGYHEMW